MVAPEVQGIDLLRPLWGFKIANRSISGWVPSFKMGSAAVPVKLPFCSQLEEHLIPGPTFDASRFAEPQQEQFHRNLRAVEQVLAGAKQTQVSKDAGIPRPTLSRLVKRTKLLGSIACVPYGSYTRKTTMHPAFQECIRRLYLLPTRLTMTAIREHTEMQEVATRLTSETGKLIKLPSYAQVRKQVQHLSMEPELVAMREGAKSVPRERESAESFALSIPAPALLTQVDEHTMDLSPAQESETTASQVSSSNEEQKIPPSVSTEQASLARSRKKAEASPAASDKCPFSGDVQISLQRFEESGVARVECPGCGRTWTLSPSGGVLRFKSHDKRKTTTPNTGRRWAMRETIWKVIGGENK